MSCHHRDGSNIGLIRVDYNGPRHINPKVISSEVPKILHNYSGYEIKPRESHVHIYVDGEDLDWAIPLMDFSKLSEEERDGINLEDDELTVEATDKNFIQKKHYLLQALLEVHELEQLAEHTVKSLFKEDVEAYLDEQNILYTKDVKFTGFNGLDYHFDFQVPKRNKEYVLKAANSLQKNTISSFVYSWQNVKKLREKNISKPFDAALILNDVEHEPKPDLLEALQVEKVEIYFWSDKERLNDVLL